jgi:hypothetical protein
MSERSPLERLEQLALALNAPGPLVLPEWVRENQTPNEAKRPTLRLIQGGGDDA